MTSVERFAEFASDVTFARLPADVVVSIRRRTLDLAGCMLAAAADGAAAATVDAVRAWAGARETGVAGFDFRAPAAHAALANGTLAGALAHDAVHVPTLLPIDAVVITAALATIEEAGKDGRALIEAAAVGTEVAARIAAAGGEAQALAVGAAAAAAHAWGLSEHESAAAMAHAITLPAPGSDAAPAWATERMQRGWSAMTGVIAADLARRGVSFDATRETAAAADDLGLRWDSLAVAIKPYPASLWVHPSMDAAAALTLKAGDIEEILCTVPPGAARAVCEPRGEKIRPVTDAQARFSLQFAVASAVVGGRSPADLFSEDARSDRRVLSLAERVGYEEDPSLPVASGRVRIMLRDGRVRDAAETVCRGAPGRELLDEELRGKFSSNARRRLDQASAAKLAGEILRLDALDSIDELIALAQGG